MLAVAVAMEGAVASVVRPDPRTGRLVRSVVAPPRAVSSKSELATTVERVAHENQLSPELIHSVIAVESGYNANAVSPKGALGLMQLIPSTAERFGVSDAFDPADNIQGGARYLKYLLDLYSGNDSLALAAYNAGEAAVARYGGIPPYPETQNYVEQVRHRLGTANSREETGSAAAAVQARESQPPDTSQVQVHNPIREVVGTDGKIYYTSD
jgi:soluble lytic murein transglycosylase-like protein